MTEMTPAQLEEISTMVRVMRRNAIEITDVADALIKMMPRDDLPEPSRSGHYS